MHILFTVTDFDMGGITTSLRNFSAELIKRGHRVSILNLPDTVDEINFHPQVNIIPLSKRAKNWNINISDYVNAKGLQKIKFLFFGVFKKILNKLNLWEKFIFADQPIIECDVAVAYRQSPICYYICTDKTTANKTIAFIHSEFDGDCSSWLPKLKYMDYIACVSDDWSNNFRKTFPRLKDKVYTVYNIFNQEELKNKSKEFIPCELDNDCFKMVTAARIDFSTKRLDMVPQICGGLKQKGVDHFKWYIVGDGKDKNELENKIIEYGLENHIVLLGAKTNPYPYIKNSDLFVLISKCESYGMVIEEAKILGVPILASKYPALYEIMTDGVHGLITEKDLQSIVSGLEKIYNDKALYEKLKTNCENYEYDCDIVYNQFMKLCH